MPLTKQTKQFRYSMARLIILPVGLILLSASILAALVFNLLGVLSWQQHSYEVLAKARESQRLMTDMESGLRGYLLNRNKLYLEPYNAAQDKVVPSLDTLEKLVIDNSIQVERVQTLRNKWGAWYELSRLRLRGPSSSSAEESLASKNIMDSVRDVFAEFTKVEENLRAQRLAEVQVMRQRLIFGGSTIGILLIVLISTYVTMEVRHLTGDYKTALTNAYLRNIELAEQKEWFRVTLSSIGDAVIVTDKNGKITFMNRESQRMTGWKLEDATNKSLKSVFHIVNENTRAEVEDPVDRVLRENKVVGLANHTVLLAKDGPEWPIEDSAAPIHDRDGGIIGVVLVFHDASALRMAHRTLQDYSAELARQVEDRTRSLSHAVEEMEAFSYTVSHDLRSPLRAMQGYAQALLEDYSSKLDENGILYLNRINNAAQRLDKLIQDLLAYTRLSRDRTEIVQVDLDNLTRQMLVQYPQFQPPRANVTIEGQLLPVYARETTLTQILSNLIDNAIKFVPAGTSPEVKIWTESKDANVRLSIRDNGIGIAPEDRERIFKIFEQVHSPKTYGGTGIGLAIVKRAVENLGGTLGVDSSLKEGSTFWIELRKG